MRVFHSPKSVLHAPQTYFRRGRSIPHFEQPDRYDVLMKAVVEGGHEIHEANEHGVAAVLRVHSERYVQFLAEAWKRRGEIEPDIDYVLPSHFARPEMSHYPEGIIGRVGFHMADLSTPIHEHTYTAVMASADAALSAAQAAMTYGYAYGLCRPPGHHASTESAGGFCFINNTAVAAAQLQAELGCKVGIIDIDVHHGNGTQIIFYQRDDVVTTSIHADPSAFMPYYAGYANETGAGPGAGCNLNLPLALGSGDEPYLSAIDDALEFCAARGVEALVVALGLDASEADPNGALAVTTDGFYQAGAKLAATRWPTVLIQEGGYLSDILGENLKAILAGFEQAKAG